MELDLETRFLLQTGAIAWKPECEPKGEEAEKINPPLTDDEFKMILEEQKERLVELVYSKLMENIDEDAEDDEAGSGNADERE